IAGVLRCVDEVAGAAVYREYRRRAGAWGGSVELRGGHGRDSGRCKGEGPAPWGRSRSPRSRSGERLGSVVRPRGRASGAASAVYGAHHEGRASGVPTDEPACDGVALKGGWAAVLRDPVAGI